jgi:hypothetical protein
MAVECTQTTHQKETVKLIKDFFDLASYNFPYAKDWGNGIISRLFGVTGIKFNKPFMAEVFEGSFTTSSLLEKYPMSKSQVMYIFTMREKCCDDKTCYEVKATRVYNSGKVFIDGNRGNEKYFDFEQAPIYFCLDDYNSYGLKAIKTLVLVANKENVVEKEHRISVSEKEDDLIQYIVYCYDYTDYKTRRVKWVEREDNTDWVALREGSGKKYKYQDADYCEHFDKSGYCVVALRKTIIKRLRGYSDYLKLKRLAETDYSQELQARYNEIIVLKNLVATNIINNTDSRTLSVFFSLTAKVIEAITLHEKIMGKLKKSRELYEQCEYDTLSYYRPITFYDDVVCVRYDFENIDHYITEIRTKLFDELLQQDI